MHKFVVSRCLAASALLFAVAVSGANARTVRDSLWNALLKRHVAAGMADYSGFKTDPDFAKTVHMFSETAPDSIADPASRKAFWINAYNIYTIQLIVDHPGVKSIKDVSAHPWDDSFITIAGVHMSLNHIENDILRKRNHDPFIHFGLVCAAKSCPPLRNEAYEGASLKHQLEDNARQFMAQHNKNYFDAAKNTLHLSPIFDWYRDDFVVEATTVPNFVRHLLGESGKPINAQTAVQYTEYDWSLNGK